MENKSEIEEKKKSNENIIAGIMLGMLAIIAIIVIFLMKSSKDKIYKDYHHSGLDDYQFPSERKESKKVEQDGDKDKEFKENIQVIAAECTANYYEAWITDASVEKEDFFTKEILDEQLESCNLECVYYEKDEDEKNITMEIFDDSDGETHKVIINYTSGKVEFID